MNLHLWEFKNLWKRHGDALEKIKEKNITGSSLKKRIGKQNFILYASTMPVAASSPQLGFITLNGERIAYSVFRSKRRKRTLAFKVERDGSLRILVPYTAKLGSIEKVLEKRAPWIVRERDTRKRGNFIDEFTDGAKFSYLGHTCVLRVTHGGDAGRSCALSPRVLHVHVPEEGLSPKNLREEVRLEILLWIKKRARAKLKKRLDNWAKRLGVAYKKLVITSPQQRWGSCSADNIIRLNWRLMMAPLPILDYVAAHELCHIRHKDHSARFWKFLEQAMPDYGLRRKALRSIERDLII
jgi:predicted metal-dependent hydrolase